MKRSAPRRKASGERGTPAVPQILPLAQDGPRDVQDDIFRRNPELRACLEAAILCAREAGLGWHGFALAAELRWAEAARAFAARLGARSHMNGRGSEARPLTKPAPAGGGPR